MIEQRNIKLTGAEGRPFLLDVFAPDAGPHRPLVIFQHGFKGFKDWGCWDQVATAFAEGGFVFIKFNVSHNGTTVEDPMNFADLEAFGQNNFTKELDDLQAVLDWALAGEQLHAYGIDPNRVALVGHSRGGATVLLKAHEDERVSRVVTWASVGNLDNYMSAAPVEEWRAAGVHYIDNARTGQRMPLYFQLLEDLVNNAERLNLEAALRELTQPYLVVHGSLDQVVPYAQALHVYENTHNSTLETIMGGDHAFGGKHPWTENQLPDDLALVVKKTMGFLGN